MNDILIRTHNAVHNIISCEDYIAQELDDYFTFEVPNAVWIKRKAAKQAKLKGRPVKFSGWDGKIRLFSRKTHKLYAGLDDRLEEFTRDRSYTLEYENTRGDVEFSEYEARQFIATLGIPAKYEIRDYQLHAFVRAVRKRRLLTVSATGSGKSLMIYLLLRYYATKPKALLIVPTLNLLHQMFSDFADYGYDSDANIHLISAGESKNDEDKDVFVSTWQSIYNLPKQYFKPFNLVIVDEVHGADAKSIKGIMEKLTLCRYRYGFTGTLKETQCHRLVLEGLFGSVFQATTTTKLIEDKYLAELLVKAIVLVYDQQTARYTKGMEYAEEIDFLVRHKKRNNFIKNLTLSLKGNTLVLFRLVENHGKILFDNIRNATDRPVYFISGATPGEEREAIRNVLATNTSAILVGSYGCVSTGINIPSLKHVIAASPYKSRVKVLQSIGRGLRRTDVKDQMIFYDIADDLSYKNHTNFTLSHYVERMRIYAEEKFTYKTYRVEI